MKSLLSDQQRLKRLLAEGCDLRELDLPGFRRWLARRLRRWRHDPVFVQRRRIRELHRRYPLLAKLEHALREAQEADRWRSARRRLGELQRDMQGAGKAMAGLSQAMQSAEPERQAAMARKLEGVRARRQALQSEWQTLLAMNPWRQALWHVEGRLDGLRQSTGLDDLDQQLARLLKQQGRGSGRRGGDFEAGAMSLLRERVLPDLAAQYLPERPMTVLRGVTLGGACIELDYVVVCPPESASAAVEVLAVVEVKRNPNDLGHGFRQRQENLGWLTGERGVYRSEDYRTRHFPSGHFDRPAVHRQDGVEYRFDAGSFSGFRRDRDSRRYLNRLYFISRASPLFGASSAAMGQIAYRVATDLEWHAGDAAYMARLLHWSQSLTHRLEAPEVLRLYARTPELARQLMVVE